MELTFTWNTDEVQGLITELEAKGLDKLAERVEISFYQNLHKAKRADANKQFRINGWNDGRVFQHSNGDITCVYWSYRNKCYSTVPMYINGILMGRTSTLQDVNDMFQTLTEHGFKRVDRKAV